METLNTLCGTTEDSSGAKELGFKNTDYVLANEMPMHTLFTLLGNANFYVCYMALQSLLQNRWQVIQGYFLKMPPGPTSVIAVLDDKRDIILNGEYALDHV